MRRNVVFAVSFVIAIVCLGCQTIPSSDSGIPEEVMELKPEIPVISPETAMYIRPSLKIMYVLKPQVLANHLRVLRERGFSLEWRIGSQTATWTPRGGAPVLLNVVIPPSIQRLLEELQPQVGDITFIPVGGYPLKVKRIRGRCDHGWRNHYQDPNDMPMHPGGKSMGTHAFQGKKHEKIDRKYGGNYLAAETLVHVNALNFYSKFECKDLHKIVPIWNPIWVIEAEDFDDYW